MYPLDYSRTRLSTDIGKGKADRKFNGLLDVMKKSVKSDVLFISHLTNKQQVSEDNDAYFGDFFEDPRFLDFVQPLSSEIIVFEVSRGWDHV